MSENRGVREASREMMFELSIEDQGGICCVKECGPRFSRQKNQCKRGMEGGRGDGWGVAGGRNQKGRVQVPHGELCWGI